jgi:hypothetical protein
LEKREALWICKICKLKRRRKGRYAQKSVGNTQLKIDFIAFSLVILMQALSFFRSYSGEQGG